MARCRYFPRCGGCRIQNLTYKDQLELKISDFRRIFGREPDSVHPSPAIWHYRNRMDYVVSPGGKVGLREKGKWYSCIDIGRCLIHARGADRVRSRFRDFVRSRGLEPWDLKRHSGLVRYIVIRTSKFTEELMATVIASRNDPVFRDFFSANRGTITSGYVGLNDAMTDLSFGRPHVHVSGKDCITERVGRDRYLIRPGSFFQANPYAASLLRDLALELLDPKDTAADLYCGSGFFTAALARQCRVTGVENDPECISLFSRNMTLNGVKAELIRTPVEELESIPSDNAILDPPRDGIRKKALKLFSGPSPRRLVYVSCNPGSQARDLVRLAEFGFRLKKILLVDQFPHTRHMETIALLERN